MREPSPGAVSPPRLRVRAAAGVSTRGAAVARLHERRKITALVRFARTFRVLFERRLRNSLAQPSLSQFQILHAAFLRFVASAISRQYAAYFLQSPHVDTTRSHYPNYITILDRLINSYDFLLA